jgi:cell division protein FtsZ
LELGKPVILRRENMEPFLIEEASKISGARIVAVGVGGGGGNMIGHMIREGVTGIEMIIINTDAQALKDIKNATTIQIGAKLTKGLGAGMKPEIGRDSAIENYEEIKKALTGADIVFISAGLGGGTGTGAAPIIAKIAKEVDALTISIVTKPFMFEAPKRLKLAKAGLEELKKESDSIVVIPNDKLLSIIDRKLGIKDSFKIVDSVLAQAVSGTAGVILSNGENDINLDFADLRTVMSHKGMALMGVGEYEGENAAYEAIKAAIESPLLDNVSINGAMGVLVHFHMHPNFPMIETSEAMIVVQESAHEDADVIFGTSTDETLPENYVKITIIATGFERNLSSGSNNENFISDSMAPITKIRPRLVVGGDFDGSHLDIPSYMRQQQD